MKHTQGEWFVSGGIEVVSMPSQCKIAKVSGWSYEEAQANANLIASAPELLSALEECIRYLNNCDGTAYHNCANDAQLVVNKAKGE